MDDATKFFYDHAGWSYDPKTEAAERGRQRVAQLLAKAEAWAKIEGLWFDWQPDMDSSYEDNAPRWMCLAKLDDTVWASLGGIDTDPDNGDPDRRVIEAELASEVRDAWADIDHDAPVN
jgi:hypothetical protein